MVAMGFMEPGDEYYGAVTDSPEEARILRAQFAARKAKSNG